MKIDAIEIFRAEVPLTVPYKVSRWTFTAFHPLIASIRTRDGRVGWGEATITAGYAVNETPETGGPSSRPGARGWPAAGLPKPRRCCNRRYTPIPTPPRS